MQTMLKKFAETILLLPMLLGTFVLGGWLFQRQSFWIDLGFLTLGLAGVSVCLAMSIWAAQLFHPRYEAPKPVWRVPALASAGVCLALVYFAVALAVPVWTTITLVNTGDQVITEILSTSCLEEDQRIPTLAAKETVQFQCIPKQEGSFDVTWQQAGQRHRMSTGYMMPDHATDLIVELQSTHQRLGI